MFFADISPKSMNAEVRNNQFGSTLTICALGVPSGALFIFLIIVTRGWIVYIPGIVLLIGLVYDWFAGE